MQEKENITNNTVEEEGLNIKTIVACFLDHWKLFVISVIICLFGAAFYLYRATPVYQVSAKILLADKEKGSFSSQADFLNDFGFQAQNTNVENEIEVISSMSVARGAVLNSGLYTSYTIPGFKSRPIDKSASPVIVSFNPEQLQELDVTINLHFNFNGENPTTVEYTCFDKAIAEDVEFPAVTINEYPFTLNTIAGVVTIEQNEQFTKEATATTGELNVSISPLENVARSYMAALSIAPVSKTSSVAMLSINTPVPAKGVDYINAVIESYNYVTNEDKRQVARKTEAFIIDRIDSLKVELRAMEMRLSRYKKDNQIIDPSIDANTVSRAKTEYTKQLEEVDVALKAAKYLSSFVNDPNNDNKIIPTTFGVVIDQSLTALINNYNKDVLERNQLLTSATAENPALKASTIRVESIQADLRSAIAAFEKSLSVQRDAVELLVKSYSNRFAMSPDIERELLSLKRECEVKSGLYVMLLQKYEENALSLAVTADNLRCIDAPSFIGQVAPKKNMVILFALFLGLAIPAGIVYIKTLTRTQLTSVDEIQKLIKVPHVGTIPFKHGLKERKASILVDNKSYDIIGEAFRSLRTNLQFVMNKSQGKVTMFTSTTSGEGKTFIAANLAACTALLGKKVLLIGMDIRRPRLAEMFGFNPNDEGLTSYLAADPNQTSMLDKFIKHNVTIEGLDILPAGIVPPNPAELLSRRNLDKAIEYLSEIYDSIIIDAAPIGLVTDTLIASRVTNAVIYVVRLNYSHREDISYINSLIAEGKLENLSIVINGEELKKNTTVYGGSRYSGYGYGYGYGQSREKK